VAGAWRQEYRRLTRNSITPEYSNETLKALEEIKDKIIKTLKFVVAAIIALSVQFSMSEYISIVLLIAALVALIEAIIGLYVFK
jgi:hypothetical protein